MLLSSRFATPAITEVSLTDFPSLMGIVSSGVLYDVLRQYRLLSPDRLAQLPGIAQGRCGDARSLAKLLIQRDWLTIYQANEILAGNADELVYGPYHVLDVLGKGGLSLVFRAKHFEYDWTVALKVLRPEALSDDYGRHQFLKEMEAMEAMDHPNIVQFCDVDQVGDTFYFAMEYVAGVDLGKHVSLSGPLPATEACEYIRQTALGLQHAHERNLVHRDIKPVNLLLTHVPVIDAGKPQTRKAKKPLIKLLDWGLADWRLPKGQFAVPLTAAMPGMKGINGTIDYLSPEQARDASTVDIRGDIYSLGCTFYFLLMGQPPFPEGNLAKKLMLHQSAQPKPIRDIRADVPDDALSILDRMLAKKPEDRFQTPAAVALALKTLTRGDTALATQQRFPSDPRRARRKDDTPLPKMMEHIANLGVQFSPSRSGSHA